MIQMVIVLARDVARTGDVAGAQKLVRHKQFVTKLEHEIRKQHFNRLRQKKGASIASSNHLLEITAALKEINSKIATIGYAILDGNGGLKKTRLKSSISQM